MLRILAGALKKLLVVCQSNSSASTMEKKVFKKPYHQYPEYLFFFSSHVSS
jgi:hypothetical protein